MSSTKSGEILRIGHGNYCFLCIHCGFTFLDLQEILYHIDDHYENRTTISPDTEIDVKDPTIVRDSYELSMQQSEEAVFESEIQIKSEIDIDETNCFDVAASALTCIDGQKTMELEKEMEQKRSRNSKTEQNCTCNSEIIQTQKKNKQMSSSESENDSDLDVPTERTTASQLPEKSKVKYERTYGAFKRWLMAKKFKAINEKVLLAYFSSNLNQAKSSTSWSIYSILKATINMKNNIDISNFNKLKALLKRKSDGYKPPKTKILTKEQIFTFLKEAPDELFLAMKVALIVGVYCACRRDQLTKLKLEDIEYMNDKCIKITVPQTKNKIVKQFIIDQEDNSDVNLVEIVKKYANLRPASAPPTRFFVGYRKGKCTKQFIGVNTIGSYPKKIATYLNLHSPNEFTGHCFKRSSHSLLGTSGCQVSILKKHCGWDSDKVRAGDVENSFSNKRSIAGRISDRKKLKVATQKALTVFNESSSSSY